MSAPRKPLTPNDPRHGTNAGAVAHLRQGISICDPCRLAVNEYAARSRPSRAGKRPATRVLAAAPEVADPDEPTDPDELTGGAWVPVDGIMRWQVAS